MSSPKPSLQRSKTEFGADAEADKVLNRLPRVGLGDIVWKGKSALLGIDGSGRLNIAVDGGGLLSINERDLVYIHGDDIWEG